MVMQPARPRDPGTGRPPVPNFNIIPDPYFEDPSQWFLPGNWTIADGIATLLDPAGVRRMRNTAIEANAGTRYRVGFTVVEIDTPFGLAPMVGTTFVGSQAGTFDLGPHEFIFDPADAQQGDEFGCRNVNVANGRMAITGFWAVVVT
jgi:hypothetical protein